MKHVKMFGKSVPLIAIVLISVLAVGTFAAVLSQYATVEMTATMTQSVLIDKDTFAFDTVDGIAGHGFTFHHVLKNRGGAQAPIYFDWSALPDEDGLTVKYLRSLGYGKTITTAGGTITPTSPAPVPVAVTVEDLGCQIKWTFDMGPDTPSEIPSDGHWVYSLSISFDGVWPAFQIHNNDGVDHGIPFGTHVYSAWGPTVDDGGWGWHTGWDGTGKRTANNIPVDDFEGLEGLDWVTCTGEYKEADNRYGIYTVTIDKGMLAEDFYWAVTTYGNGLNTPNSNGGSQYPATFSWGPLWTTNDFSYAEISESIDPYTMLPYEVLDFYIWYVFETALVPDTYTITSTVKVGPAP